MRWSHLARHGLLSTSLVGATAHAEPCGFGHGDTVVGVTIGIDFSPKGALIGGIEMRSCLADASEAMLRFEVGGGGGRLLGGARTRLFEKKGYVDDWGDHVGMEGGLGVELFGATGGVGVHLALSYGSEVGYLALQGLFPVSGVERPNRGSFLVMGSPSGLGGGGTPGRPVTCDERLVLPDVLAVAAMRCAEDRAVRDHFTRAAQHEYSSVWTFLRLAAELAAVGAPPALISRALDAADDEVRHAELCARAAGGLALTPVSMLAAQPRFTHRSSAALAVLAGEAWSEGVINEGAAAEEARLAAGEAAGSVRAMLATISRDEEMHAALATDVLGWVHSIAPEVARDALAAREPEVFAVAAPDDSALARRGVASAEIRAEAWAHGTATAMRVRGSLA